MRFVAGIGAPIRPTFTLSGAATSRLPAASTASGFASSEQRRKYEKSYLPTSVQPRVSWRGLGLGPHPERPSLYGACRPHVFPSQQLPWVSYLPHKGTIVKNPIFQSSSYRLFRGGYWSLYPYYLRPAWRNYDPPSGRGNYVGFRIFRTQVES